MLEGLLRDDVSKGSAKALRREGYLIANVYGNGRQNIHCAFKQNDFIKYVRSKPELKFKINVGGTPHDVVILEYQKDPVKGTLMHVDMMFAQDDVLATYLIPVKVTGFAVGTKNKGVLIQSKRRIRVKCRAKDLPNEYLLDVTDLNVGDNILVRDLVAFEGVTVLEKPSVPVVGVIRAR